jgi:murein DD-endopeptidase MepM/ murein hydrolase activator NlpD
VVNVPGAMGTSRSSSVTFARSDGVHVMYGHVQDIAVQHGDRVTAGQPFARVGNNGFANGPHSHIGAWRDKTPLQIRWDLAAMATSRGKH